MRTIVFFKRDLTHNIVISGLYADFLPALIAKKVCNLANAYAHLVRISQLSTEAWF